MIDIPKKAGRYFLVSAIAGVLFFSRHAILLAHADVVINDGSVQALYHLDEASGTSPYADSANSVDLTNTSVSRTPTSSLLTYGAYFTESGSALENDTNVGLATSGFSIAGWIRPEANLAVNTGYVIAGVHDTSTKNFAVVWYGNESGTYKVIADFQQYGISNCYLKYNTTFSLGTWHHIVYEASGTLTDLFVDNSTSSLDHATCSNTAGQSGDTSRILVGKDASSITAPNGSFSLDEVAYFNLGIDTSTRSDLYNSGNGAAVAVSSTYTPSISSPGQFQANASTTLAPGASTAEGRVVFKGTLTSSSSHQLYLQVEVQPSTTTFANIACVTSAGVSAGSVASTTFVTDNSLDGNYHWQYRVRDAVASTTSAWTSFGTSTTSTDFAIGGRPTGYQISDGSVRLLYHFDTNASNTGDLAPDFDLGTYNSTSTPFARLTPGYAQTGSLDSTQDISPLLTGLTKFSLFTFYKTGPSLSTQNILMNEPDSGAVYLQITGDRFLCHFTGDHGTGYLNGNDVQITSDDHLAVNTGYLLGCTWGGYGTRFTLWENGVDHGEADTGSSTNVYDHHVDASLQLPNFTNPGGVDELFLTNTALSSSTIQDIYDFGAPICLTLGCGSTGKSFYTQIKNTENGRWVLHSSPSSSTDSYLERFPEDWIVYVSSTVSATGTQVVASGTVWYDVVNPTDGVEGWMPASSSNGTVLAVPTSTSQATLEASSSATTGYVATSSRPNVILSAIDHFYNDTSRSLSLYSGSSTNNGTTINLPLIKNRNYPKEILWGIAARETGTDFDNSIVTKDYGHGITQLTPLDVFEHEPTSTLGWQENTANVPANGSFTEIFPCRSFDEFSGTNGTGTDAYIKCYTEGGTRSTNPKLYKPYEDSTNTTYKYYTNTWQSIYANIKDGMRVLQDKFPAHQITTSTTPANGTTTYTGAEREIIIATEGYGPVDVVHPERCGYVGDVADELDTINSFFPGMSSSSVSSTVRQMHQAATDEVCVQIHSPGDLSVSDSTGKTIGVVNGEVKNDFLWGIQDPEQKWVKILFPGDTKNYTYKVRGTGSGVYGIDITIKHGSQRIVYSTKEDNPIVPGEVDTYNIDEQAVLNGQNGVTVNIDSNGDGTIDKTMTAGATVKNDPPPEPPATIFLATPAKPPNVIHEPKASVTNMSFPTSTPATATSTAN